ncbi:divalent ion tolerance protein CutA [Thermococcus guaymasensis DSM 11113]|uniref:Divalent ion tolerance protein CutA n=1 Tax=Thermococcus guaymasensis DSM 11113 TaxID=1432656 RepID=A0A0X1KKB4_9EURY|nr:divalent-cation tolerance protein CutA [Thermococcus guaymasensis]AJC71696.1 divalent ion tolerance protein CutA [Thermococcus guaymasensis DSM 11113]
MEAIFVYTTFPDWESAKKVVRELLERKLVVCANMREHEAMYWWEGKIEEGKEIGVILKTEVSKWKDLREALKELHPYTVPVIARIDLDKLNREYSEWMAKVLFG